MSESQYGAFNVYMSWQDILIILCTLYLAQGVYMQGLVKYDEIKEKFTSSVLSLSLTVLLLFLGIYCVLGDTWRAMTGLTHMEMLAMFLSISASTTYMIWARKQRVELRYKRLVFLTILVAAVRPAIGIVVVLHSTDKVTARVVEMALVDAIFYCPLFVHIYKSGRCFFHKGIWKYALKFNIPLIPHFLSQTVLNSADRIMIGTMIGASEAGIYSLAYQISLFVNLFNNALLQSISPWTYKKLKGHKERDIERIGVFSIILVGVIDLLFIAFAPELVGIFAPSRYREAVWVIPPITMSVFFQFMYALFVDVELYAEKSSYITVATMVGAVANLFLNALFIRAYGYYAAGYTTLFCYMLIAVLHYIFMTRICKETGFYKPYRLKKLAALSAALLTIGFLMLLVYHYRILRYCIIAGIVLGLFVYKDRIIDLLKMK